MRYKLVKTEDLGDFEDTCSQCAYQKKTGHCRKPKGELRSCVSIHTGDFLHFVIDRYLPNNIKVL